MKFFQDFFKGIGNCFKGFGVLFNHNLWPYMFVPLVLWLLLWFASLYGLKVAADTIGEWLQSKINAESIPESGNWLSWIRPALLHAGWLLGWILRFLFWIMSGTFVKYLVLIILSPLFALLSEKTEEKLGGKTFPFSFSQLMKDIGRGIAISLRNMLLEYLFIFGCFVVCLFFPPLIFLTTPFLLVMGWYFVGFSIMDYNCERHKFGVTQSAAFMRKNKGYVCGVGLVYGFFLGLPFFPGKVLGLLCGPAIAVVGGTISFLEIRNREADAVQAASLA